MRKPFNAGIAVTFNSRRSGISGVYLSYFDSGLRDLTEKRIKGKKWLHLMSMHFLLNMEGTFEELQNCDRKMQGL